MQKINIQIDDGIYIKKDDIPAGFLRAIMGGYHFTKYGFNGDQKLSIFETAEKDGEKCIKLPPTLSYFKKFLKENNLELGEVLDTRVAPEIPEFHLKMELREHQVPIVTELEKYNFNAILSAKTGFGKSSISLYLAKQLRTPLLFIASRTTLIGNLKKDCQQFNVSEDDMLEINSEWLKNPVIKPVMFCVTNTLCNENIQKALYNNVGLLVADEIHLGLSGKETRNAIYSINPKHRLYLSATPNLAFKGLAEASLSMNEVSSEETIDFKINVSNIEIEPTLLMRETYYRDDSYIHKKNTLFLDKEFMEKIAEAVAYNVIKNKRVSLVYLEHTSGQEFLKDLLQDYGIKVAVINTNTKKKEQTYIIENFDNLDYDVVISGSSISAGVSFYKLSTIFNINITLNENNLVQLIGRLKRKNDKICDKSKEFIQITVNRISDRKWAGDKGVLKSFDYLNWRTKIEVKHNIGLIDALKEILGE